MLIHSKSFVDAQRTLMPEAEVSLRLALFLIENGLVVDGTTVHVAIDGAQVKVLAKVYFDFDSFLATVHEGGWHSDGPSGGWRGEYAHTTYSQRVRVHSEAGCGDVVARLITGQTFRVECKKGPLVRSKSSSEYPLLREALGQLLTLKEVAPDDLLAVAVPESEKFLQLASKWRDAPLIQKLGVLILTVSASGVSGLPQSLQSPLSEFA